MYVKIKKTRDRPTRGYTEMAHCQGIQQILEGTVVW